MSIDIVNNPTDNMVIALVGNPNVGKSSVFNALTGMRQHTGNWPGKTIEVASGRYSYKGKEYVLVDLPGTYSLYSQSEDEKVTVSYLEANRPDCVVVVGDATALERNLYLALQVMAIAPKVILCVNLLDEAERKDIHINLPLLESSLGIPVCGTSASTGQGLDALKELIRNCIDDFLPYKPLNVPLDTIHDTAEKIAEQAVVFKNKTEPESADRIVLGRISGFSIIFLLLLSVFWLTMVGANVISDWLSSLFSWIGCFLVDCSCYLPQWLFGLLYDGIYQTVTNVLSVMLPPMMIFYPLFSFLEDLGYLPRAAFLMDSCFHRCGSCGKQALTMTMGYGCNTVGVMGCRIIASKKERFVAIATNALVPCNGRFPTIMILISIFFSDHAVISAFILVAFLMVSVMLTLVSTWILHKTVSPAQSSCFMMELPPYRRPNIKKIIISAFVDRTLSIIGRAVMISAPAGVMIWILQFYRIQEVPLIQYFAEFLNPIGIMMGMSGAVLASFLLSFPANELLLPITLSILQCGNIASASVDQMGLILKQNGLNWKSAVCIILFTMFHWPCGTTCFTIYKETKSVKWTVVSILLPTIIGITLCTAATLLLKIL